jgi:hypothetical protein
LTLSSVNNSNISWDEKNSGLTKTGQITIAVAGAVITGVAGSFATWGVAAISAGAGTAGTIATTNALNASVNTDGNLLSSLEDVGKTTIEETTSDDSLRTIAVSAAAAGLATKAMQLSKLNDIQVAVNASNTQRIATNSVIAGGKIAVNTASYTVANSTINGTSVTDSLKDQDTALLAAQLVGEVGAKEIGLAAHTNNITQEQQLALHAVLGCGLSAGAGGNCASGAVAGVTSEFLASEALKNGTTPQNAILIGQSTGAASALLASTAQGRDDEEVAKDISLGAFIGINAATNNAVMAAIFGKSEEEKFNKNLKETKEETLNKLADEYTATNNPLKKAALATTLGVGSVLIPESANEIELGIATGGVSKAYAPQIGAALNKIDDGFNSLLGKFFGRTPESTTSLSTGILKPDFYSGENGVTISATGYRAIGGPAVTRAIGGDGMSERGITYFTFDDVSRMSPGQAQSVLQLDQTPSHYIKFDTLHQFDSIQILTTHWNEGVNLEPFTSSYPEFGIGGATQVITTKPIENFTLNPLSGAKK